jgi:uncharacterized protein YbbC (DUF1343 family)
MCKKLLVFFGLFFYVTLGFSKDIRPAAYELADYLPKLKRKSVAVVANAASMIGDTHLVDVLIAKGIKVKKIMALEHGFRGDADAGEHIVDGKDPKTGLPVISLYGSHKKATRSDLADIDVILFDVQDVGVRYFTFISSLYYLMEGASQFNKEVMVLDRPNPNGDYVAGPMLDPKLKSFVGMYDIPLVHGLTVGELALMAKGQRWFKGARSLKLSVVKVKNYTHQDIVFPRIKPSPNLPTDLSIRLYPSLALFEPTVMSIGRGTFEPFTIVGGPSKSYGRFSFTPQSIVGMAKKPKFQDQVLYGESYRWMNPAEVKFSFGPLVKYFRLSKKGAKFFTNTNFFNLLTGSKEVYQKLLRGAGAGELLKVDRKRREKFLKLREKYKLYPL